MKNKKIWDIVNDTKYQIGDMVRLSRKRTDGYPRHLQFDTDYYIIDVKNDVLTISTDREGGWGSRTKFKINKLYILPLGKIRDLKIDQILK